MRWLSLDAPDALTTIRHELKEAGSDRIWYIADAFRAGMSVDGVFNLNAKLIVGSLVQIEDIVKLEQEVKASGFAGLNKAMLNKLKRKGFADARLSKISRCC